MAKIRTCLLLAIALFCSSYDCLPETAYSSDRVRVIINYTSQIGVREATGHNDGKDVEKYLKTVGLGKGYAWCAAYVKWSLAEAKVDVKTVTGAAASLYKPERWIYYKGKYKAEPMQADVFCLYYESLGRIGHTGFFDGWANKQMGTYKTVEGNTNDASSREGDGCYRRIRQIRATHSINRWVK